MQLQAETAMWRRVLAISREIWAQAGRVGVMGWSGNGPKGPGITHGCAWHAGGWRGAGSGGARGAPKPELPREPKRNPGTRRAQRARPAEPCALRVSPGPGRAAAEGRQRWQPGGRGAGRAHPAAGRGRRALTVTPAQRLEQQLPLHADGRHGGPGPRCACAGLPPGPAVLPPALPAVLPPSDPRPRPPAPALPGPWHRVRAAVGLLRARPALAERAGLAPIPGSAAGSYGGDISPRRDPALSRALGGTGRPCGTASAGGAAVPVPAWGQQSPALSLSPRGMVNPGATAVPMQKGGRLGQRCASFGGWLLFHSEVLFWRSSRRPRAKRCRREEAVRVLI